MTCAICKRDLSWASGGGEGPRYVHVSEELCVCSDCYPKLKPYIEAAIQELTK